MQLAHASDVGLSVPQTLWTTHIALIQEADRQGVSLNLLIATVLAGAVGRQHPPSASDAPGV